MKTKLKMENLTKVFGDLIAVNHLNLEISEGEFVCFVGPSGCGKTTTLNMLSGLEKPTEGKVILDDVVINNLPARMRDIGLIFQDYAIFENMNVYNNVGFSLKVKKTAKKEIEQAVKTVADRLYLTEILDKDTSLLSPGELQRVAIARTMLMSPSIFLMDEPLDNLDAEMRVTMRGELKQLQKDLGKTMVYVTHDQEEAISLADRVVVIKDGELQQFDTPQNIYNYPLNKFVGEFVGRLPMNFIKGRVEEEQGKLMFSDMARSFRLDVSRQREAIGGSKELLLGIRPEHIIIVSREEEASAEFIVRDVEILGMENVVEFQLKGGSENLYKMTVAPEIIPNVGHKIYASLQLDKVHIIDLVTEMVLS